MRNFDEAREEREKRDRSFVIGGETFTYRAGIAPEAFIRYNEMDTDTPEQDAIAIIDEAVVAFLEPGQDDLWRKVRDPQARHPLNIGDMRDLLSWLFEEQTNRPLSPGSDSSAGSEQTETGTGLTAVPSLPVASA
jgi:hypothetical protein